MVSRLWRNVRAVSGRASDAPLRGGSERIAGGELHTLRVFGPRVCSRVEPRHRPAIGRRLGLGRPPVGCLERGHARPHAGRQSIWLLRHFGGNQLFVVSSVCQQLHVWTFIGTQPLPWYYAHGVLRPTGKLRVGLPSVPLRRDRLRATQSPLGNLSCAVRRLVPPHPPSLPTPTGI